MTDKEKILAEIERLKNIAEDYIAQGGVDCICARGNVEVKEVDLEKELVKWHKEHFKKDGTFIGMSGFYLTNNSQIDIAKHFFELGLKAQKGE